MNAVDVSVVTICLGGVVVILAALGVSYFRHEESFLRFFVKMFLAGIGTMFVGCLIGGFA